VAQTKMYWQSEPIIPSGGKVKQDAQQGPWFIWILDRRCMFRGFCYWCSEWAQDWPCVQQQPCLEHRRAESKHIADTYRLIIHNTPGEVAHPARRRPFSSRLFVQGTALASSHRQASQETWRTTGEICGEPEMIADLFSYLSAA
jgi:hypothetical protein